VENTKSRGIRCGFRNKDKIRFARECRRNNCDPRARFHISGRDEAFPRLIIRQRRQPAIIHSFILLAFRPSQSRKGSQPFTASFSLLLCWPFLIWRGYTSEDN